MGEEYGKGCAIRSTMSMSIPFYLHIDSGRSSKADISPAQQASQKTSSPRPTRTNLVNHRSNEDVFLVKEARWDRQTL